MKKLKIRGKEIRRLGYVDDKAARLAVNLAATHYGRDQKLLVLGLLQDLLQEPGKYVRHDHFAELANYLNREKQVPGQPSTAKRPLKNQPSEFAVFGRNLIDPEALNQMNTAMKMPVVVKGALMADAHVGYGLPIGGVVAAYNAVMPYGVGMDIACRMHLSVYPDPPELLRRQKDHIKQLLTDNTRFGLAEFNDIGDHELMERREWKEIAFIRGLKLKFYNQLGTSGHGNHFVDIGWCSHFNFQCDRLASKPNYFLSGCLGSIQILVGDNHVCARLGQTNRQTFPNSLTSACYKGNFSIKLK